MKCRYKITYLHGSDDLASAKIDIVKLGDPQGAHAFVQCCSVHVDGGTQRQNKAADAFVDAIELLNAFDSSWQSRSAMR